MFTKSQILPRGSNNFEKDQYRSGSVTEVPGQTLVKVQKSDKIRSEYISELFSFKLGEQNKDRSFPVLSHNRVFFKIGSSEKKLKCESSIWTEKRFCATLRYWMRRRGIVQTFE